MQKILVIDDDALVRSMIARVLRREGYEVMLAADGASGLRMFCAGNPDLVVTDIIMPEKEGLETIREFRSRAPDVKIIAISGSGKIGDTDFLTIAAKLGATEVLGKPFQPRELVSQVARCLAG
ncbi:MAG TPA: response regulator [Stellaceae bacterium]|nr:response regulator [Stellaceae bacterium]